MKILFITNYAAPYRVNFFDELGKHADVTVLFSDPVENITHRNRDWFEESKGGFQAVQLKKWFKTRQDENLCPDVLKWLRKPYDVIVVCGYSSPTTMLAMAYLKLRGIPFHMEVDGGLIREESRLKYTIKRSLVRLASSWISTGNMTTRYLVHYGADPEKVAVYPFTSLQEGDILQTPPTAQEKAALREELQIPENRVILSVGQFIHRKGYDILLHSAARMDPNIGIYIVGGEPTQEYRELCHELGIANVHFLSFMKRERLAKFYKAADAFVLPTREDIWGLVVNEAMAYGLPVVTTDRCVAGLELVEEGETGAIVPVEEPEALAKAVESVLSGDLQAMGEAALQKVRPYTIANMVKSHLEIFTRQNQ